MAAAKGKSLKAYIENILVEEAEVLQVEVSVNPSPSGDTWFNDPANITEIKKRVKAHREHKTKITVTLKNSEDIKNFIKSI